MTVELPQIRNLLLPGLWAVTERFSYGVTDWNCFFVTSKPTFGTPHIWVPKLTLPQTAIVAAAGAVIQNPVVTRRFWAGWRRS